MNHAKALIIDENKGTLGSQNLDSLSFDFNSEIGVPLTILGLQNAWNSPYKWAKNILDGLLVALFQRVGIHLAALRARRESIAADAPAAGVAPARLIPLRQTDASDRPSASGGPL